MTNNNFQNLNPKKNIKWKYFLFTSISLALVLAGLFFWIQASVALPNSSEATTKSFEVAAGDGASDVVSRLKKEGLIKNHFSMIFYLSWHRLGGSIQAGSYQIPGNLNIKQITALLVSGQVTEGRITIPEGWTAEQIDERFAKNTGSKNGDFTQAAVMKAEYKKFWFLADLKLGESLEGFLYPDTYQLKKDPLPADLVMSMLTNFESKIGVDSRKAIEKSGMSTKEIISLAAIVEREVSKPDDRKLVASVFLNRLRVGMPLESCATIQYILKSNKTIFSYEETRTPSPYNTYINPGLTPGPIGNPSIDSVNSVLDPVKSDYYFFLSSRGTTYFSKNLDEHNKKKSIYLTP